MIRVHVQPKTYKSWVLAPKCFILSLVFDVTRPLVTLSGCSRVPHDYVCNKLPKMASGGEKVPEVIDIPDNGNDEDVGPVNVQEARAYKEKVEEVFNTLSLMLNDDWKDAIPAFKKLAAKHWIAMKDADVDIIVRSIKDSAGIYLRQMLTEGGVDVVESVAEVPLPREFLQSLPEKRCQEEEKQLIIATMDHTSEAHAHTSTMCANILSLAKFPTRKQLTLF